MSECKGGDFTKNHDKRHLFLWISPETPGLCYYCNEREEQ